MSAYSEAKTVFKDAAQLVAALEANGYKGCVSTFQTAQELIDFQGRKTHYLGLTHSNGARANDTAEIIIRSEHIKGASNDIGFRLNPQTGTYGAVISEYDSYVHNAAWLNKVNVSYAQLGIVAKAKKLGLVAIGKPKTVNGKIQYQYMQVGG